MFRKMFRNKPVNGLTAADLLALTQFSETLPESTFLTLLSGGSRLKAFLKRWREGCTVPPATFIERISGDCVSALICCPIPGDDENFKTMTINAATISELTELLEEALAVANYLVDEDHIESGDNSALTDQQVA